MAIASARPTSEDIAARARRLIADHIGRGAMISGPRLVDGRWEVAVYWGDEARWALLARLRFDGLGRLMPVSWPRIYERLAALLNADENVRRAIPGPREPSIWAEAAALSDTEPITGLPALWVWDQRLRREVARWQRTGEPFCAGWLRIAVSSPDSLPLDFAALSALWRLSAHRLRETMRTEDLLAAGPPGEFALVLVANLPGARAAARRLIACLSRPFRLYETGPEVSISAHVGLAPMKQGDTVRSLSDRARRAAASASAIDALAA